MLRKHHFQTMVAAYKAEENRAGHEMGNKVNLSPGEGEVWLVRSRCRNCNRVLYVRARQDGTISANQIGGTAWGCRDIPTHAGRDWAMNFGRALADEAGHSMAFPSPDVIFPGVVGVISVCCRCLFTLRVCVSNDDDVMVVVRACAGPIPPCSGLSNPDARGPTRPVTRPATKPDGARRVIDL